ncbi:MAG: ATP-binding protein [Anaerovoracaceae bacterium]
MKIAVLSGKGGTGKTFVSVNLANVTGNATYIDCDVEEPNGHLFFKPDLIKEEPVYKKHPFFNKDLCSGCRKCVDFCQFNALAFIGKAPILFDEVCHSCEGCKIVCKDNAIQMEDFEIGVIQHGQAGNVTVLTGILNIGQASGIPIIDKMLTNCQSENVIIDCPPGSACSVMDSIKGVDYCLLVAEPTVFGLHNLEMVYDLVKLMNKPCSIVLNKSNPNETLIHNFAKANSINIICEIPFSKKVANLTASGEISSNNSKEIAILFNDIIAKINMEVSI